MSDFQFLQNPISGKWVISAPKRAKRPDVAKGIEPVCPFCPGREKDEEEVYRVGGVDHDAHWQIRVLPNKFPFTPIHLVIIDSPDHHKTFDQLALSQVELIFKTYRKLYNDYKDKGEVYIFHNHGAKGGESLPHPHTQLAVIPFEVKTDLPRLDPWAGYGVAPKPLTLGGNHEESNESVNMVDNKDFYLFCPLTSQWPDEVWIAPKKRGQLFGEITDEEISDLSFMLQRLLQIFNLRHGNEFPFNFYIYPGGDWYLRLIPRMKSLGGFEIGTGIFVNTQDPKETVTFLKEHFKEPNTEKIEKENQAEYRKGV